MQWHWDKPSRYRRDQIVSARFGDYYPNLFIEQRMEFIL